MKLRRLPEDFQVEERTLRRPDRGPFALYRLTKTSIGTPEAIAAICRQWNIPRRRISYGGLKDRHAVTVQHLTIHHGPPRGIQQSAFHMQYLGQVANPFTAADIQANRFQLTLRDMQPAAVDHTLQAVQKVCRTGLPNYFDDQRFGSLGITGEWIGRCWCLGDYERALWLALADSHPDDSAQEKQQKAILRELWGRWTECKQALQRSHRRSIVTYLADKVEAGKPADLRGAFARINVDLRGLYLSAWQSALWNRLLTRYQQAEFSSVSMQSFPLISGQALFLLNPPESALPSLDSIELPLPSARIDRPSGLIGELLDQVLQDAEMELRQLRVKYPRDSFFSKGSRRAFIHPQDLQAAADNDELYARRSRVTLSFELPRGSYATILVKRVTTGAG